MGHQRNGLRLFATICGFLAIVESISAQSPRLRIVVLEGEDAVNIVAKRTAVQPTVEVR